MIEFERAEELIRPQVCYSLRELNELMPELSPAELIEARLQGLIPRSLGEGVQLHFLGADVIDFLHSRRGKPPLDRLHRRHASRVERKHGRVLADD